MRLFLAVMLLVLLMITLSVAANPTGIISYQWTAPATNTDGTAVTAGEIIGYKIYRDALAPIDVGNTLSYTFQNVPDGTTMTCTVTAYTASTESAKSNAVKKSYIYVAPVKTTVAPSLR